MVLMREMKNQRERARSRLEGDSSYIWAMMMEF